MTNNECTKCIHKCVCKTAESCDGYVSGCKHFVVISNLETTTKQEWISVKDRLPENDAYINATSDGIVVPAYWHNDRFYAFTAIGVVTVGGVTHWMPLPEPPKGE